MNQICMNQITKNDIFPREFTVAKKLVDVDFSRMHRGLKSLKNLR